MIVQKLRETIFSGELALKFKMNKQDFTRARKQPFSATLLFMINLLRRSLSVEIDGFVTYLNERFPLGRALPFTASAFVQNTKKIDPEVFRHLYGVVIDNFYSPENEGLNYLKGIRVLAVDASKLTLPYTAPGLPASYGAPANAATNMAKGLLTASKTGILNPDGSISGTMLWSVHYYDNQGRNVKTYQQHYLNNTQNEANYDEVTSTYDFTGQLTKTVRQHHTQSNGSLTLENSYAYDHMGRKLKTYEQINMQDSVLLSQLNYNEVGQLYQKQLHGINGGGGTTANITLNGSDAMTSGSRTVTATNSITLSPGFEVSGGALFHAYISGFLQTITYNYNERGWLKGANTNGNIFNMELKYNDATNAQYNGNIGQMGYSGLNSSVKSFSYAYDKLNRLNTATSTGNALDETIGYDQTGNIMSLTRGGSGMGSLAYNYTGNQLTSVTGYSPRVYLYDANGNATSDGVSKSIDYNMLNLPRNVANGTATYTYDATGQKLRNTSTTGSGETWDYIAGIVYHNNAIDFIGTEEGRAVHKTDGTYSYEYNLKDHLGNNRVSIDSYNGAARVIQEDEYYSFGLRKPGGYDLSNNNRYLYNGKELQTDLANQYDYGARFYDPVIARWTTPDPLAEKSRRWSPYTYAINNPIRFIDPDGKEIINIEGGVRFTGDDAKVAFSAIKQQSESKGGISGIHFVREAKTPTIYKDALTAFRLGKPNVLHYLSDKEKQDENRDNAIGGYPKKTSEGLERQEYPYASTYEGGEGAYVTYVPSREQRVEGGQLGVLYRTLNDGDSFLVLPVPRDKEPDAQKQPSPVPFPMPSREATKNVATGVGIGTAAYILYKVIVGAATWECGGCGVFVTP